MQVDFEKGGGLVPAVVQDVRTGDVLMLGYMNEEALAATQASGRVTFYSRSRQALWTKGESSGNWLHVEDIAVDCDRDTLLVRVTPQGATCHTGATTCWGEPGPRQGAGFISSLAAIIDARAGVAGAESYTRRLLEGGPAKAGQKVGEEAVETVIAALAESDEELVGEAADLVYHLLVLLKSRGVSIDQIGDRLRARHGARG